MTCKALMVVCSSYPLLFPEKGLAVSQQFSYEDFRWSPEKVVLYTCNGQNAETKAHDLREKLFKTEQKIASACVLEFFLENPDCIPEEWKKYRKIYFWGTIYNTNVDASGTPGIKGNDSFFVRFLAWNKREGAWKCEFAFLNDEVGFADCPAAVLSSSVALAA